MKGKRIKSLTLVMALLVAAVLSGSIIYAEPTTDPEGGDLTELVGFNDLADLASIGVESGTYVQNTDFTLELMNDGAGEDGKYVKYTNTNTTDSAFVRISLDLGTLGVTTTDFSAYDELWFWQTNTFGIFGLYSFVELVTNDDKIFSVPNGDTIKYGSQDASWTSAATSFGIYTAVPGGAANWVRVPFASMKNVDGSGTAITEADLANIKAIKIALPINLYMNTLGVSIDSVSLFTADPEVIEVEPKITYAATPVNDTFVTGDSAITATKVILSGEEFVAGTMLGVAESEPVGLMTDNMAGTFYDFEVMNDDKGQSGNYFRFTAKDVPTFSYTNQIFSMLKFAPQQTDWSAFNELWVWADVTGFGNQFEGTDFSIQLYEKDPGSTSSYERWSIGAGKTAYYQDGTGWKAVNAWAGMMTRLPKDFKGWVRVPFSSFELVRIRGVGNETLDLEEVYSIVTGIPCDVNRIGYSMALDTFMLVSASSTPSVTAVDVDLEPMFDDYISNTVPVASIVKSIVDYGVTEFNVNVRSVAEVAGDLFTAIMGEDITVTINICDEDGDVLYSWILNGLDITSDSMADLTVEVLADDDGILAGKNGVAFSLAEYDSDFPGTLVLRYAVPEGIELVVVKMQGGTEGTTKYDVEDGWAEVEISDYGTYALIETEADQDQDDVQTSDISGASITVLILMLLLSGSVIWGRRLFAHK